MSCPIAVPHGNRALLHSITAPIVEGTGANLPGLIGLDSLKANRAILDMDKNQLIFSGPGEVKYELPPGSKVVPLEVAPSGHLVMVTDSYGELPPDSQGGVADSELAMWSREVRTEPAEASNATSNGEPAAARPSPSP